MTQRKYKTGTSREQIALLPARVEDYVSPDALVRAVDAYVDTLDMEGLGFRHADGGHASGNGQPPYDPRDHLKLYLYGYLNKIRSSRCLERETKRNMEVIPSRINIDLWHREEQVRQGDAQSAVVLVP